MMNNNITEKREIADMDMFCFFKKLPIPQRIIINNNMEEKYNGVTHFVYDMGDFDEVMEAEIGDSAYRFTDVAMMMTNGQFRVLEDYFCINRQYNYLTSFYDEELDSRLNDWFFGYIEFKDDIIEEFIKLGYKESDIVT